MLQNKANLPRSILILPDGLNCSVPLYKTEYKFSIFTVDCLTFQTLSPPLGRCQFYNSLTIRPPRKKNKFADLHSRYLQGIPLSDLSATDTRTLLEVHVK